MSDPKGNVVEDRQGGGTTGGNSELKDDGTVHHTNWDQSGRTSWDEKNGEITRTHETEKGGEPRNIDTDNRGNRK